tara:strand:+ start:123635 stop:124186 length:552 start_codon:yes stop_codon:yes gene_type:complete
MISGYRNSSIVLSFLVWIAAGAAAEVSAPMQLLQQLNDFPHAQQIEFKQTDVLDYEVGLGAMQKLGGAWKLKHSQRFNGTLTAYTWQLNDGFTSLEVMNDLLAQVAELETETLMFSCDGRACGSGVQWANRVFQQPVLYGREALQYYRVFSIGESPRYLLLIYAAARTADRQYLHTELLQVTD